MDPHSNPIVDYFTCPDTLPAYACIYDNSIEYIAKKYKQVMEGSLNRPMIHFIMMTLVRTVPEMKADYRGVLYFESSAEGCDQLHTRCVRCIPTSIVKKGTQNSIC